MSASGTLAVPLGRSFPYRRQGEAMEQAEALLLCDVNGVFEDAIEFLIISQSVDPVETLAT